LPPGRRWPDLARPAAGPWPELLAPAPATGGARRPRAQAASGRTPGRVCPPMRGHARRAAGACQAGPARGDPEPQAVGERQHQRQPQPTFDFHKVHPQPGREMPAVSR
jgi:hypothetical protein